MLNTTSEFLKFLNNREIHLGLKIKIKSVEAFDKSILVSYGKGQNETLSHVVCERLLIEKKEIKIG
jgi:DtxR family Mn-dependent transcriptional regulator